MVSNIKLMDIVVPKRAQKNWQIGKVIGMKRLDLSIGPILVIKDLISGSKVEALPMHVYKMVRVA